jgi:hypothetical protein
VEMAEIEMKIVIEEITVEVVFLAMLQSTAA